MPATETQIDTRSLRNALGAFPTGVAVVTACTATDVVAIAVNSFTSVSLDPPLLLWCINHLSARYRYFEPVDRYVVSVLAREQRGICERLSRKGEISLPAHLQVKTELGPPAVAGALSVFECMAHDAHPHGDHSILIGKVVRFRSGAPSEPLVFCGGEFRAW